MIDTVGEGGTVGTEGTEAKPMPSAYCQLLDATISHLESLKQRGVLYVDVSPELLLRLTKPTTQKTTK